MSGNEVFLSFTEHHEQHENYVMHVDTLCTNRDVPARLPYGGAVPAFKFWHRADGAVARMASLMHFTPSYRPPLKAAENWQLISQLSLNYLSLTENTDAVAALKAILRLYNRNHAQYSAAIIDSISHITTKRITARHPTDIRQGFCQGTQIELEIDEKHLTGSGIFLFSMVLEQFFALYCSINSFSKLILKSQQRGIIRQWQPRLGSKQLL